MGGGSILLSGLSDGWLILACVLFPFACTAAGASLALFTSALREGAKNALLGAAAGIMIASSVWSLIVPALEIAKSLGGTGWIEAGLGILAGALALAAMDALLLHAPKKRECPKGTESPKGKGPKAWRFFSAVTLHNIPEGLAVGVALGVMLAAGAGSGMGETPGGSLGETHARVAAIALSLGIGLQNIPEGAAVAFTMRRYGTPRLGSFAWGALSGAVEPPAALLGMALASANQALMPWLLCFAAGAMLLVLVEDLIPEAQSGARGRRLASAGTLVGFVVMMALDVALG